MNYTINTMTKEQALATASVMELIEALEKALPQGEMVVIGNGEALTDAHKKWLIQLAGGCGCGCDCKCHEADENENYKRGYDEGYNNGYDEGYADAADEYGDNEDEDYEEYYEAMQRIISIIDDIGALD